MFNHVEEFPSLRIGHVLKYAGIAAVLVAAAITGYVVANPVPLPAEGAVLEIKLYTPGIPGSGAGRGEVLASANPFSKTLLVLAPARIRNVSDKPLTIFDLSATVRLPDAKGGYVEYESASVSAQDFARVFQYYRDLAPYQRPPLLRHAVVQPGQTIEGLAIFHYPLTEEQWDQRTSFQVTTSFEKGSDIVLTGTDLPGSEPRLNAASQ